MIHQTFSECNHVKNGSLTKGLTYCFTFSVLFVLNLYIIVPSNIRVLPRNDPRQIKWRFASTISTSFLSTCFYPLCFCENNKVDVYDYNQKGDMNLPAIAYMGWARWRSGYVRVLLHTAVLFIGPLFVIFFRAYLRTTTTFTKRRNDGRKGRRTRRKRRGGN